MIIWEKKINTTKDITPNKIGTDKGIPNRKKLINYGIGQWGDSFCKNKPKNSCFPNIWIWFERNFIYLINNIQEGYDTLTVLGANPDGHKEQIISKCF